MSGTPVLRLDRNKRKRSVALYKGKRPEGSNQSPLLEPHRENGVDGSYSENVALTEGDRGN